MFSTRNPQIRTFPACRSFVIFNITHVFGIFPGKNTPFPLISVNNSGKIRIFFVFFFVILNKTYIFAPSN